ncbi:hypothetical protein [Fodinicola feengrottensis]|uniref:hypothetical protein n=1 Tax=Fodinicola feengrottensis TaxID=435914 RepID=UPI002442498F|nr:hypothetical protein [Fodinicola feengrottensis]
MNKDVVAVDQDWGGQQGALVSGNGTTQVWAKPMSDGSVTVALLNRGPVSARWRLPRPRPSGCRTPTRTE